MYKDGDNFNLMTGLYIRTIEISISCVSFALVVLVASNSHASVLIRIISMRFRLLAERSRGRHRVGRAGTRQSTICLTVDMQVLLYPEKNTSHAPSETKGCHYRQPPRHHLLIMPHIDLATSPTSIVLEIYCCCF